MDALSEILQGVKLRSAIYFSAEFSSPWAVGSPQSKELAPLLSPGSQHLVIYHFVVAGSAQARLIDGPSLRIQEGEILVLPHGDAHELSSSPRGDCIDDAKILAKIGARDLSPLKAGGGGATTRLICGYMGCDTMLCAPILGGLPPIFKVNARADRTGQWLENAILHLVDQASVGDSIGSSAMLSKLSEALFVDALRRYVASMPADQIGWLAGARDPLVGRSLTLLHGRVGDPWTLNSLAEAVGVSRSALVARFNQFIGEPPMAYLTRWRLKLAAKALLSTPRGVAEIAADVGYESEAAFNRAFKRTFGLPPARYRKQEREAGLEAKIDSAQIEE